MSNFIIQALKGDPITVSDVELKIYCHCLFQQVFSPGNQTRSFMYITDLVRGLILLMNSNFSKPVNLVSTISSLACADILVINVDSFTHSHSLSPSLPHSLTHSLTHCLTHSLARSQGNPDEHTILEFARIVTKATGE